MALLDRMEYLRTEHGELLNLACEIEKMLELASKNDFAEHLKSLNDLPSLERGLARIVKHCRVNDRIIASTYKYSLQQAERDRIAAEHGQIIQAVTNFREELKFATADRTMAMILPGMDVVNRLRSHIAYEREMVDRIVRTRTPKTRIVTKKRTAKRSLRTKRKHARKRKTSAKASYMSYTLEPHPEL
ncbi:MAG: hypothetical protein WBR10_13790 [Candidatus Acidiferrum sp.]